MTTTFVDLAIIALDPEYGTIEAWAKDSDYLLCTKVHTEDDLAGPGGPCGWVDLGDNPVDIYGCYVGAKKAESAALEAEYEADPEGKAASKARADFINAVLFHDYVDPTDLTVPVVREQMRLVLSHPLFTDKTNPLDDRRDTCVYVATVDDPEANPRCAVGQWGHWFLGISDDVAASIEGGAFTYLAEIGVDTVRADSVMNALQTFQTLLDGDDEGFERVPLKWSAGLQYATHKGILPPD